MKNRCLSRAGLVHEVVEAVPLLLSTAFAVSSVSALAAPDSKPFPSPPLSAALAVGPRKPARFGVTVNVALRLAPPADPVIVTDVELATALVVTGNVALVAPAATVTLAGTVATAGLLLDKLTTLPPGGAAAVNVAVTALEHESRDGRRNVDGSLVRPDNRIRLVLRDLVMRMSRRRS